MSWKNPEIKSTKCENPHNTNKEQYYTAEGYKEQIEKRITELLLRKSKIEKSNASEKTKEDKINKITKEINEILTSNATKWLKSKHIEIKKLKKKIEYEKDANKKAKLEQRLATLQKEYAESYVIPAKIEKYGKKIEEKNNRIGKSLIERIDKDMDNELEIEKFKNDFSKNFIDKYSKDILNIIMTKSYNEISKVIAKILRVIKDLGIDETIKKEFHEKIINYIILSGWLPRNYSPNNILNYYSSFRSWTNLSEEDGLRELLTWDDIAKIIEKTWLGTFTDYYFSSFCESELNKIYNAIGISWWIPEWSDISMERNSQYGREDEDSAKTIIDQWIEIDKLYRCTTKNIKQVILAIIKKGWLTISQKLHIMKKDWESYEPLFEINPEELNKLDEQITFKEIENSYMTKRLWLMVTDTRKDCSKLYVPWRISIKNLNKEKAPNVDDLNIDKKFYERLPLSKETIEEILYHESERIKKFVTSRFKKDAKYMKPRVYKTIDSLADAMKKYNNLENEITSLKN